jgi:hypothetical protein
VFWKKTENKKFYGWQHSANHLDNAKRIFMKTTSLSTDIIEIIISCLVVLFVFSFCTNRFETIVVVGLVVIYANIVYSRSIFASLFSTQSLLISSGLQKLHPDDKELNEIVSTQMQQIQKTRIEAYVAVCRYIILGAICAWKIIVIAT